MDIKVYEAFNKIFRFRWENLGYGKFRCLSCGAFKYVDYGDHEQPKTEKVEECSKNCPWRIVEEYVNEH